MANYKEELERTERQDLEIKKHISDVKDIVKSKVNKDVNGLNSIKVLLENETLGGYTVDDFIKIENLEVVDVKEYAVAWGFTGHINSVNSVAVDSDGNVYSGADDKNVIKISPTGEKIWEFTGHTGAVWSVAVDKDGNVYSGSYDKKVIKISPTGEKIWEFTGHTKTILSVAVDSDGNVYSGGEDKKVIKNELKAEIIGYKIIKKP